MSDVTFTTPKLKKKDSPMPAITPRTELLEVWACSASTPTLPRQYSVKEKNKRYIYIHYAQYTGCLKN